MTKIEKKYTGLTFRNAAIKHLKSCEKISAYLSSIQSSPDKPHLLANLYYLSGYVLECIYKYGILSAMGKKHTKLTNHELKSLGLKSHDLRRLRQDYLDVTRKKKDPIFHDHFINWDVQLRYSSPTEIKNLDETLLLDYLEQCIKPEYNSIRNDY